MVPKRKNDDNGGPPDQSDGNDNSPQPLDNQNTEPLKPPGNGRVTRSVAAKRGTPVPDEVEPPQPKKVQKGGKKGPPRKKLELDEEMTRADMNDTLENQREGLVNALRTAERSAEAVVAATVTRATRMRLSDARKAATATYEDSLHFRVPQFRSQFAEHIDDGESIKKPLRKEGAPVLWTYTGYYRDDLWPKLESYERHNVGTTETLNMPALNPNELHLIVPAARRAAVGLGEVDPPVMMAPINLGLDIDAIERRRASIEDDPAPKKNVAVDGTPMLETHTQRRARQMQQFYTPATKDNPSRRIFPTNLYVHETIPTARNLDKTLLDTGVVISAGESSYNWNDSYDQTDIVKLGYIAVEEGMVVEARPGENDTPPRSPSPELPSGDRQPDPGVSGLLREFARPRPEFPKTYQLVPTTDWAETTYGRREREHAYMDIRPPSPVLSPPHSPIFPVKTAANTFHVPADIPRNHPGFRGYRSKFKDKYSVNFQDWPAFKTAPEGRGKEVVYEPLDIAALKPNQQKRWDVEVPGLDANGRFEVPAPEGTSMRLYREAFDMEYQPPIRPGAPVPDEESDDEGDLFRESYLESSGGQGGGSATQGDGGEGGRPEGGSGPQEGRDGGQISASGSKDGGDGGQINEGGSQDGAGPDQTNGGPAQSGNNPYQSSESPTHSTGSSGNSSGAGHPAGGPPQAPNGEDDKAPKK